MSKQIRFRYLTKLPAALAVFLTVLFLFPVHAKADENTDFLAEYEAIQYGADRGLLSTEANAVAQTPDGYLWVGTYSGLYRYDGVRFERADLDSRISNVMVMFVDRDGMLWIGTNDSGLCRYVPETGEVTFYTMKDGMPSDSIRCITQDDAGDLYIGTVAEPVILGRDGLHVFDTYAEITGVRSFASDGETVAGVTNEGLLFFLKGRDLVEVQRLELPGLYYESVCSAGPDRFLVGTSGSRITEFSVAGGSAFVRATRSTGSTNYINAMLYDPEKERVFFCGENGVGFLDRDGVLTDLAVDRFQSSVSDVIRDSQGNLWFVSNKQGVLEYTLNPFVNVFVKAGLSESVVNSLLIIGDELYIAKDDGLSIIDKTTYENCAYDYLSNFDGVRIRHLMKETGGNLWVSTYGKDGLVRVTPDGQVTLFNEAQSGTLGGRFRYCLELSNGVVAAASNMGLNLISGDRVIATVGIEDGLSTPQILTMVEREDGAILAGSDGDGIYVIKDGAVIGHIGAGEGLETQVVMRIVPCRDGYLYVTSNALYYDDGQTIKRLTAFPYSNNYDIYISSEEEAWISSSAGLFIVRVDDLIGNGQYHYTLLDYSRGFNTSLTANAWNTVQDVSGDLLLCCTDGVRRISTTAYNSFAQDYPILVKSITCDDEPVKPGSDGTYVLPAAAKRIQIQAAVLNYTLANPLVHLYFEGASDEGTTLYQDELSPLAYTNLPYGRYTLHIQILDSTTYEILRDETCAFYKEPRLRELWGFRLAIAVLAAGLVGLLVWWFINATIIRRQNEQLKVAKAEADRANSAKSRFLANMSHEIRTPINTIMGMDEMILREDRTQDAGQYAALVVGYANSIKRASESLLTLVNDILDLSKIESGKMNLVEREYDTTELFHAITTMIRVRSNEKDLAFHIDISPELPAKLYGDDGKIKQVLLNLLTNAVKYTKEGSFTLKVELREKTDDTCLIAYSVRDTGIGIRPEDMEKLFSAFERLDEKKNSGIQGTGLGLDISRQFVELMGDHLQCESVYGEGSVFFFSLRQKIVDETPIGEYREESDATEHTYVPRFAAPDAKVLVVDDNEMNLLVLKGLLKGTRVQIGTAMSGRQCLQKLEEEHFDIVLLDHMMPEMDGIETLHELRKTHPDLPVLALTANAATSGEEYYVSEGFQGYLSKPVDGERLEERLEEFLPKDLLQPWTPQAPDASGASSEAGGVAGAGGVNAQRLQELAGVPGLSVPDGIRFCGSEESFLEALDNFRDMLAPRAQEIEDAYRREDWEFYTIKVHALKSSARIIGAGELSALAASLEEAGKTQDLETIHADTEQLLGLYRSYTERLGGAAEGAQEEADGRKPVDPEMLADAWSSLGEIAQIMDFDSAEMIFDELSGYRLPEEDEALLREVRIRCRALDWDGVTEIVNSHRRES